jgi:hypothetical protein
MALFSDEQIKQLQTILQTELQIILKTELTTQLKPIYIKLNDLDIRLVKVETKLNKLETSFNGYVKKEGDIYELKINDIFDRHLNDNNKLYKELHIGNFYSPTKLITDLDGLFIVNYLPPINNPLKKRNIVNQFTDVKIIIIESKHDLDKSKIDNKLQQIFEIQETLVMSNNSQTARLDYKIMLTNNDFKTLKSYYNHTNNNIYIYFAAENITKNLEDYIQKISDGSLNEQDYIDLTNKIINTHDKKLIDKVIELGKKSVSKTQNKDLEKYINNFKATYEYINMYTFNLEDIIEDYHNIMLYLKTFTLPFSSLQFEKFTNKVGFISNMKVQYGYI